MNEVVDWISVLSALASVAVAIIGFSGLLTAFRTANAPLSQADMVNIRILLIFGCGALVFALLPLPFAAISSKRLWPVLTVLLAAFLLVWPLRSPSWNRARGVKPKRRSLYLGILAAEALLGLVLLGGAFAGYANGGLYSAGVAWCVLVAIVTFVAHVFGLLPVDHD